MTLALALMLLLGAASGFRLEFKGDHQPPAVIPASNEDLRYNVPAMRLMAVEKEVIVRVLNDDGTPYTTPTLVTLWSVLATNWPNNPTANDAYPGRLCNLTYHRPTMPYRRWFFEKRKCHEDAVTPETPKGSMQNISDASGDAVFHGLFHTKATENGPRVLAVKATIGGVTKMIATNPIVVHHQAKRLELERQPPASIESNTPMNFTVRIIGHRNDGTEFYLTRGLDAVLHIDLGVAWYWKFFYNQPASIYRGVRSPDITLAGRDVFRTARNDLIIRKRAVNGTAYFDDVRILEKWTDLRLNFTMSKGEYDWRRVDENYTDVGYLARVPGSNDQQLPLSTPAVPSVFITNKFNVIAQTAVSFSVDSSSLNDWEPVVDANFPFPFELTVTAYDANGNVVTGGPDSMQSVTTKLFPSSACLSIDSSFDLVYGKGRFLGSICRPDSNVQLELSITTAAGTTLRTGWLPPVNVTGDVHMAVLSANFENHDTFARLGVDDLNDNFWWKLDGVDYLADRHVSLERHDSKGDVQTTLKIYTGIQENLYTPGMPKVRAIIGPGGSEILEKLSSVSQQDEMPIVAYNAGTESVSDKTVHPYVTRINSNDGDASYGWVKWHLAHYWDRIIVLRSAIHELPASFYLAAKELGLKIELEINVPVVKTAADLPSIKIDDKTIDIILKAKTRVIYAVVSGPTMHLTLREAIEHKFAPIHGWQWTGVKAGMATFPYINNLYFCRDEPYCSIAFTGVSYPFDTYDVDYDDEIWKHVYIKFLGADPAHYHGALTPYLAASISFACLPYEAVVAYGHALQAAIRDNRTMSGKTTFELLTEVNYYGITGTVTMDEKGDRPGFRATLLNVNARFDKSPIPDANIVYNVGSYVSMDSREAPVVEIFDGYSYYHQLQIGYAFANTTFTNTRTFLSRDANKNLVNLTQVLPAAHYCEDGCGGELLRNDTIFDYEHGVCVEMNTCLCRTKPGSSDPGYTGRDCSYIVCTNCKNGLCVSPDVCQCNVGWTGSDCGSAICSPACENGECIAPDVCQCNSMFVGASCNVNLIAVVLPVVISVLVLVVVSALIGRWYFKKVQLQAALANLDWRVNFEDVFMESGGLGKSSMLFHSMASMKSANDAKQQKNMIRNVGKWNGIDVVVKKLNKPPVDLTFELRMEMKTIRELRHPNLVGFVGASIDAPCVCILSELVPKGSLDDVLANEDIKVEWNFRYSLLKDIARGLQYLQKSELGSHGRLKSSNCIVDNRWTCKLSDHGLTRFRSYEKGVPPFGQTTDPYTGEVVHAWKDLLWTAPELLKDGVVHPDHVGCGTKEADVYSFGVIMAEMASRDLPFAEIDMFDSEDIIAFVAGKKTPPKEAWIEPGPTIGRRYRPTVLTEDMASDYKTLMESCWQESALERPNVQGILSQLNVINPQQGELVDNLINMLEKYSTNLEGIVAERTAELAAEKQKTEDLVARMLPKAIVEDLKHGRTVSAETFECVTIYFSDIVGFTSIAGNSTPLQVVDLLNDLYTCFDSIIDNFDVYKVETIGDAYMVVSGLPIRNGDRHAGEIATMSLHLLSALCQFKIRHMPGVHLQLRIGLHSGPCVAGVVGLKMPRYCLFGDTVNTASRMESGGLALRVHMSNSTAEILQRLGGYQLECRGEREVKGKGVMKTWWLLNKDGFDQELPSLEKAASASQHEFK